METGAEIFQINVGAEARQRYPLQILFPSGNRYIVSRILINITKIQIGRKIFYIDIGIHKRKRPLPVLFYDTAY